MAILGAKTFKNYIDGAWVDASSGETFESTSPADGETIGTFPKSGREDVDRAVAAAKHAYDEWRLVPAPKRGEVLFRFAQLLAESKDDLTDLMTHEMGKVKAEAAGDVQEAIDMAYYMGGEGRRLFGQTTPSELRDKFQMSVRMPVGVVGGITPWYFPIAIPAWKMLPALACGDTIVFKPATDTPLLGERFVELLVEAGVPNGVVNIRHEGRVAARGAGREAPAAPRLRGRDRHRPRHQPERARDDPLVHCHRHGRGREAPHGRRGRRWERPRRRLLLPADRLRRRPGGDADRAGGDLRPDHRADSRARPGRGDLRLERCQ